MKWKKSHKNLRKKRRTLPKIDLTLTAYKSHIRSFNGFLFGFGSTRSKILIEIFGSFRQSLQMLVKFSRVKSKLFSIFVFVQNFRLWTTGRTLKCRNAFTESQLSNEMQSKSIVVADLIVRNSERLLQKCSFCASVKNFFLLHRFTASRNLKYHKFSRPELKLFQLQDKPCTRKVLRLHHFQSNHWFLRKCVHSPSQQHNRDTLNRCLFQNGAHSSVFA